MRYRMFVALLFSLTACGKDPYPHNALIEPYLNRWNKEFNRNFDAYLVLNTKDYHIEDKKRSIRLADCRYENGIPIVTVYLRSWGSLPDIVKEATLYHEFGHCDLLLDHDTRKNDDGCAHSVMYPLIPNDYCYTKHRKEYMDILREAM